MAVILIPDGFHWRPGTLAIGLERFDLSVHAGVSAVVDFNATRGEAYMKARAAWQDQTGAARAGLSSTTDHKPDRHLIVLAHSVAYGIWLETRRDFNDRYAIILMALRVTGDDVMRNLDHLLGKIV